MQNIQNMQNVHNMQKNLPQTQPTALPPESTKPDINTFSVMTEDGLELKGQLHLLPKPQATIYIVHGFSEHQGRYAYLIQQCLAAGFQVITYDHRGHGLSGGKPGCTPKLVSLIDDLVLVLKQTQSYASETANFLYAHSMGGGLALNMVLTQTLPMHLAGVIGSSPWLQVTTPPSVIKLLFGRITRKLLPTLTMSSGIKAGALTHDTKIDADYFADPLVHQQISSELFFGMQEAGKQTLAMAHQWPLPMLLMHGDMDPVTEFRSSVQFYQHAPKHQVQFKAWPGLLHETHQEINRDEVIGFVLNWISNTLNTTPTIK